MEVNPTLYKDNRTQLYTFTKDAANGNWLLKVDNDARELGFWPKNIFTALGDGANYVEWGGEVYTFNERSGSENLAPDLPSPPMGSRSSILETTRYDAYCRLIKTFNEIDYAVNVVSTKAFSDVNQYQVKDEGDIGEAYFQHLVLFGGPGGYTGP
uniref:Neprosin PEP catalytic domain-containing protein n=1 Tax=Quercus lobata TaxID=97700 RepID=A0A7N2MXN3_QUELO